MSSRTAQNQPTVTGTTTGVTDHFYLAPGIWRIILLHAGAVGSSTIEVAHDDADTIADASFVGIKDIAQNVVGALSADGEVQVYGGGSFRLNVATHNSDITITARKIEDF